MLQNLLECFVGLNAVHSDGTLGEIVALGRRPEEFLVRFEDGVCSSQSIKKLKVRGVLLSELLPPDNHLIQFDYSSAEKFYKAHFKDLFSQSFFHSHVKCWKERLRKYSNEEIKKHLTIFDFSLAEYCYQRAKSLIPREEYERLLGKAKDAVTKQIKQSLDSFNFSEAEVIYRKVKHFIPNFQFDQLIAEAKTRQDVIHKINQCLERYDYAAASELYNDFKKFVSKQWYEQAKINATTQELRQYARDIDMYLSQFDYSAAERLYFNFFENWVPRDQFNSLVVAIKVKETRSYIQSYLREFAFSSADDCYQRAKNFFPRNEYERLLDEAKHLADKQIKRCLDRFDFLEAEAIYTKVSCLFLDFPFNSLVSEAKGRQAELARQEQIKHIYAQLETIEQKLRRTAVRIESGTRELTTEDYLLLRAWDGNLRTDINSQLNFQAVRQAIGDYEAARLWSARAAELAAVDYYRNLGREVRDVSITQLDSQATKWRTHDLEANGIALDVKNARRSFSNSKNYSEHCIPCFKQARLHNDVNDVRIVGVLSDYLTAEDILDRNQGKIVILGDVSRSEIDDLQLWLKESFGDFLRITAPLQSAMFFPGWIFEYPDDHQPNRPTAAALLPGLIKDWHEAKLPGESFPKYLLAFVDNVEMVRKCGIDDEELKIWSNLQSLRATLGFSLRGIVGLIFGIVIVNIQTNSKSFRPLDLKKWLFPNSTDIDQSQSPLGLVDSQEYIWNFLQVFQKMWDVARERLMQFRKFRLQGPNILQGQDYTGMWFTLLAYCGGWVSQPVKAKCGRNPIYLGDSESCCACGRLICPSCGFCGTRCEENDPRQEQFATNGRGKTKWA